MFLETNNQEIKIFANKKAVALSCTKNMRIPTNLCASRCEDDQNKHKWKRTLWWYFTRPSARGHLVQLSHKERERGRKDIGFGSSPRVFAHWRQYTAFAHPHSMWSLVCAIVFTRPSADILSCFLSISSLFDRWFIFFPYTSYYGSKAHGSAYPVLARCILL